METLLSQFLHETEHTVGTGLAIGSLEGSSKTQNSAPGLAAVQTPQDGSRSAALPPDTLPNTSFSPPHLKPRVSEQSTRLDAGSRW